MQYVEAMLNQAGRPKEQIPPEYVKLVCKNARHLQVTRWPLIAETDNKRV